MENSIFKHLVTESLVEQVGVYGLIFLLKTNYERIKVQGKAISFTRNMGDKSQLSTRVRTEKGYLIPALIVVLVGDKKEDFRRNEDERSSKRG